MVGNRCGTSRLMLQIALLVILCLGFGTRNVFGSTLEHPADGPHVDIRIALQQDALRMQLTMNIVFLDEIMEFPRERGDRIDPIEGPALLDALQAWADLELKARVDGIEVLPILDGLLINDPDTSLLSLFTRTGMRGL